MRDEPFNILFLCTGNTARSILAESILRKLGNGRFRVFSAGSQPKGVVNPFALKTLSAHRFPVDGMRSKSWSEFAQTNAPHMNAVITVCDNAAGEVCPVWPGQPVTAHWGIEDPAAVEGTQAEKANAFEQAFRAMHDRIAAFLELPLEHLSPDAITAAIKRIGQKYGSSEQPTT